MNHSTNPTIILGGGFTGLFTALHLSHQHYSQPTILIDQRDRFTFQPLLYELLSEEMQANQVWPRYEELLHGSRVTFVQDTVQAIDLPTQQVELASGLHYSYSHLVLALGSTINYFGVAGAKENTLPFRTGQDAMTLARHLRNCLQRASQTTDPEQRRILLTVALVGAGSVGIELSATLADLLPSWYAQLGGDPQEIRLVLLNQNTEVLKEDINNYVHDTALSSLQQRTIPVELCFGYEATTIHPGQLVCQHDDHLETFQAATILWTAGVATHPLIKALPIPENQCDRHGRIRVTPTLQLPEFPEVFAGGDCAAEEQVPLPLLAQVAYQEGATIAHNLKALSEGHSPHPANIHLRGSLLKLGLGEGAANLFDRFKVTGRVGHLIRQGTYLELLPTPIHNFKATAEWLIDEIFQHYSSSIGSAAGRGKL